MVRQRGFTAPALCFVALLASSLSAALAQRQPDIGGAPQREAPRAESPQQHQAPPPPLSPPPTPQYTPPPAPPPRYEPPPQPRYEPTPTPRSEPTPSPRYEPAPTPRYEPTPTPRSEPTPQPRYQPTPQPRYESPQQPRQAPQYTPPAPSPSAPQYIPPTQQERQMPGRQTPGQQQQYRMPASEPLRTLPPSSGAAPSHPATINSGAAPVPSNSLAPRPAPRAVYTTAPAAIASRTANGSAVLNASGSTEVIQQVNASRLFMRGINGRPIPPGVVTVQPDGNLTVRTSAGAQMHVRKTGSLAAIAMRDRTVEFRPDGRISAIRTAATEIQRGVHGERIVTAQRRDRSVVVSTAPGRGFIERAGVIGNRPIVQRTYISTGRMVKRLFVPYQYRGIALRRYVPPVYYSPAFYRWTLRPWPQPIFYAWSWFGAPWCGHYSGYFQPYSTYPDATAWLTDYFLAETLSDGYAMENQAEPLAGYDNGWADIPPDDELYAADDWLITPEVKTAIGEEIGRQIQEEAAASGAPDSAAELAAALKPGRLFVVSSVLDVTTPDQRSCELTPGDILRLSAAPAADATIATLGVLASKRRDCPAGTLVNVRIQDLAEMLNNMRAQLDAGLEQLRNSGNTSGLPFAPPEATSDPPRPAIPGLTTAPESGDAALLDKERKAAGEVETSAVQAMPIER